MQIFLSEATSHLGSFFTHEMWLFYWPTWLNVFCRLIEQKKGPQGPSVHDETKKV